MNLKNACPFLVLKNMVSKQSKKKINFLQTTAATISSLAAAGLLLRQKKLFMQYVDNFILEVYSSDIMDYSSELGVEHKKPPFNINVPYLNHILYYIWLVFRAPFINGPIVVSGVSLPVLPIIKFLSREQIVIYYKYDWAKGVKKDYGGLKGLFSDLVQWLSIKSADRVICTTEWLKDIVNDRYDKEAVVNPNSVDDKIFYPSVKKNESIIYAGRLHWSKGIDTLIKAFSLLEKDIPDSRLLICGQGEDYNRLKDISKSSGVKNIEFLGLVDQVRLGRLIAEAKVFVLPTRTMEGHPKALVEAMACSTACIVSDVPGNNHIIEHKKTGLLFPPDNEDALFSMLTNLFNDEDLRITVEKNAGKFAKKNFGFNEVIAKEMNIIKRALK